MIPCRHFAADLRKASLKAVSRVKLYYRRSPFKKFLDRAYMRTHSYEVPSYRQEYFSQLQYGEVFFHILA